MTAAFDLDAYFERIRYTGERTPTLDTLRAIHVRHKGLIAARPDPDRRYALRNNELAVHYLNGSTERRVLTKAAQLRETLEGAFRLTLPDAPELDAALERLTAPTA